MKRADTLELSDTVEGEEVKEDEGKIVMPKNVLRRKKMKRVKNNKIICHLIEK